MYFTYSFLNVSTGSVFAARHSGYNVAKNAKATAITAIPITVVGTNFDGNYGGVHWGRNWRNLASDLFACEYDFSIKMSKLVG